MLGKGDEGMNEKDNQIRVLKRALRIAAEMFSTAGYATDAGSCSPHAIELWMLRKARKELREIENPRNV